MLSAIIVSVVERQNNNGEMSEWLKEPVLKTGDGSAVRGFESRSLLHLAQFDIVSRYAERPQGRGLYRAYIGEVLKRPKRRPC